IKETCPAKCLIVGGIGPSGVAQPLLEFCPDIDIVVVGEGERTVVELLDCLLHNKDLGSVDGIAYRRRGVVYLNRPRARIEDLTELPWPCYGRVRLADYRIVDAPYSRGCPYSCSFCDIAPYWKRRNTRRPISHFVDELEYLVNVQGTEDVFIIDDTFTLSRDTI